MTPPYVERLTQAELDGLPEYSASLPTFEVYEGRLVGCRKWKRRVNHPRTGPIWLIGTATEPVADGFFRPPRYVVIDWRRAEIVPEEGLQMTPPEHHHTWLLPEGSFAVCDSKECEEHLPQGEAERLIARGQGVEEAAKAIFQSMEALHSPVAVAALELLLAIDRVNADPRYQSVWTMYMVHGGRYQGPFFHDEVEALRKVLEERGLWRNPKTS